jgi:integrase
MNTLREAVSEYLGVRQSLGYKLHHAGKALHEFVDFMEHQRATTITQELALTWAKQPTHLQPTEWARRLSAVRIFARYRSTADPRTQIPLAGLLRYRPKRATPYLYSDEEIRSLLGASLRLSGGTGLRPWLYHCLLGLLSVTGLRASEAFNLKLGDIDFDAGTLRIQKTKFGKTRLVPLHPTSRDVLGDYIARRERFFVGRTVSSYLFVSNLGNRIDGGEVRRTFYKLSREVGLRGPTDSHGPRLHDMRHRFAVQTLLQWYRAGEDVERRLPVLSTYLGHVHVSDTYWYLSSWPELMQEAMGRLERRWEAPS